MFCLRSQNIIREDITMFCPLTANLTTLRDVVRRTTQQLIKNKLSYIVHQYTSTGVGICRNMLYRLAPRRLSNVALNYHLRVFLYM